ncbi:NAD(P)-dependent oxidoreductase [Akkermansiaceae bacterium]|nr:NAD(P)-dependent oxidoreductase [Akkermansiaceae bacterium]MDB4684332.1 NAD(P)-dependent oxidoreductase [Akkermansiaceae bacterium]
MAVFVTGAKGWIGRRVCSYLSSIGIEVVAADLGSAEEAGAPWSDYFQVDITKSLSELFISTKIDAVIHCAGYAHRPNETADEQKMFYAVNREGTKHVINWCESQGVARFLYVSSIAFYDWAQINGLTAESGDFVPALQSATHTLNQQGTSVTEDHPVLLPTHYARSKYEGEQLVSSSSLDWRIVRLATVFGEGDRANFSRMAKAMKRRLFPIPGRGLARKSVIPVELAAELLAEFALLDNPTHQLINLGLPKAPSLREIVDSYHDVCNLPRCPALPMPLARTLGCCGDLAAKILGKFPFTTDTLGKLTTSTEVSVDRMLQCFPNIKFGSFEAYLSECKHWYMQA